MPRLPAVAFAALLVLPCAALAQDAKAAPAAPPATTDTKPAQSPELDPKVQAAIQRAVDKAKEEVRNEVRAELQGAQSAAEFMGNVKEAPKLQLLELDGYYRARGQILDRLYLRSEPDAAGFAYFPRAPNGPWLSSANMRLRLEPTINASETVRVRAQFDVLDNYVFGSNASKLNDGTGSPYPIPFYGSSRVYYANDPTADRPLIIPKRVWAEVQTPVGLLTFGRQPSAWGLGILANAGSALDSDFGDSVDRMQFAFAPVGTPLGDIVIVPILDWDLAGRLQPDPHFGQGLGQPFGADQTDKGMTMALKIARLDTEDDLRRKLERNEVSNNFGLYYNYRAQTNVYPAWLELGYAGYNTPNGYSTDPNSLSFSQRGAWAHIASLWYRWLSNKWRVETELVGVYGRIGNANIVNNGVLDPTVDTSKLAQSIDINQWGLVVQAEYKKSSALSLGFELGMASGDSAPGFGNVPDRGCATNVGCTLPPYGSMEGPQWGRAGDHSINNYRFNPAYTPDLILYRRILGQVTDSWYLRPSIRWDIIPGVTLDGAAIYSQAMFSQSTPSSSSIDPTDPNSGISSKGNSPLGLELDGKLTVGPGNGFKAWGDIGMLKPLAGFGDGTSLAWVFEFGLAATF